MAVIETIYQGSYKCATQTPHSEEPIVTKATRFTPIDLLISAYGSCLLATIDHEARKNQFQTTNMKSKTSYEMTEDGSQLGFVNVKIIFKDDFTAEQKQIIEYAVNNHCHVGKSMNPAIKREIQYIYNQN